MSLPDRRSMALDQERCAACKRFIGEDCLEGHDGTFFGQTPDGDGYTGAYYCAPGKGCNAEPVEHEPCPMGCGRTTEDVYGGPCNACWGSVRANG